MLSRRARWTTGGLAAACLLALGGAAANHHRQARQARLEIAKLHSLIRPGMHQVEIQALVSGGRLSHLSVHPPVGSMLPVLSSPAILPEQDWVLWVSLRNGGAVAARVRVSDSAHMRPIGSPPDVAWGPEASDSYFQ